MNRDRLVFLSAYTGFCLAVVLCIVLQWVVGCTHPAPPMPVSEDGCAGRLAITNWPLPRALPVTLPGPLPRALPGTLSRTSKIHCSN